MAKSREELQAIEEQDMRRRIARMTPDEIQLLVSYYDDVDSYHFDRSITGVPSNKNRTYRVAPNSWRNHNYHDATGAIRSKPMRAVGTPVTVIHADGTTEVRAVSSFRKAAIATKQRAHTTKQADARHRITAADLAPIGNVE